MPVYTTGRPKPENRDEEKSSHLPPRTLQYLASRVEVGTRDNELFAAACQFRDAGFSQTDAERQLVPCGVRDGFSEPYARRRIKSAYSRQAREPIDSKNGTLPSSAFSTGQPAKSVTKPGSMSWPAPESLPEPINDGTRLFVEAYFDEKERIAIGQGYLDKDGNTAIDRGVTIPRNTLLEDLVTKTLPELYPSKEGIFVRVNPMRMKGDADKDVSAYRYALAEFDLDKKGNRIPKEIQFAIFVHSGFPIRAIIDSGNKSLQALIQVDAKDRAQFDERWTVIEAYFGQFDGFDSKNKNPSRYCRLPGAIRNLYKGKGEKIGTGVQALLALRIGPGCWEEWEKTQQATEAECRQHDAEEVARLLGEDRPFPAPMDEAAFYGIAGEIVSIIAAGNEPCRESLLGHFLIAVGNMIGRNAWMDQGGDQHLNDFGLFIGLSSIGRKGTAWHLVRSLMLEVDHKWTTKRVRRALQTGEAIIHNIRDPSIKGGQRPYTDPGVVDKRLVIMETEITRFFTVGKRRGNNLFDVSHDCWDSLDPLCCDSKTAAEEATHPHVSMIAHGTREAYLSELPESEKTNGSVNRSLILAVYRAQKKPKPARIFWRRYHSDIIVRLQDILQTFRIERELDWSAEALLEWEIFYNSFDSKTRGGMVSSILDRLPTHVVRIAMIYCALDNCCLISTTHLKAAFAFCDYYRRSAEWLFGEKTSNPRADRIYGALLRTKPDGMSRTEIAEVVFSKKIAAAELDELLALLVKAELIYLRSEPNPRNGPRYIQKFYAH